MLSCTSDFREWVCLEPNVTLSWFPQPWGINVWIYCACPPRKHLNSTDVPALTPALRKSISEAEFQFHHLITLSVTIGKLLRLWVPQFLVHNWDAGSVRGIGKFWVLVRDLNMAPEVPFTCEHEALRPNPSPPALPRRKRTSMQTA